jgi:DNA-binding LacI/PurR family transcriptional regulator
MASSVTIRDVARRAGVSTATVSYVLNNSRPVALGTRERVLAAANELGYRPSAIARGLQAGESRMLGYSWVPLPPNQFNPILEKFICSVAEAAGRHGYHLLTFPMAETRFEMDIYREMVESGRVDGFILPNTHFDDQRIRYLMDVGFPFVAFGRSNPEWEFPWVDVDGTKGVCEAMAHLFNQGHERIACVAWPEELVPGYHRLQGYLDSMAAQGLEVHPDWIQRGENRYHSGYAAMQHWLTLPPQSRPTAVVAVSDLMAIGVLNAAADAGLDVGVDVAVVGFDDAPVADFLRPPLTSLRQPIDEVGELIVTTLLAVIRGDTQSQQQRLLEPRLIVRASTECHKNGGRGA